MDQLAGLKGRVKLYRHEVRGELWKTAHDEAMACFAFEDLLKSGIHIYDSLIEFDRVLSNDIMKGAFGEKAPAVRQGILNTLRWWLNPCDQVEAGIDSFESRGFQVEGASEFRKRHSEAVWILADASEVFANGAFDDAKDAAIDENRAGGVEDL